MVCVFRLLSTKPQPSGGTMSRSQRTALSGLWAIPSTGPPTTSGHLQPIFSCVDSRGTPLVRVCLLLQDRVCLLLQDL